MLNILVLAAMAGMAGRWPDCTPDPPDDYAASRSTAWENTHETVLAQMKNRAPQVILLGDSLMRKLSEPEFATVWQTTYAPFQTFNLGLGGNTTANVMWGIRHGDLDGIAPKIAVVQIGTNDGRCDWPTGHTVNAIGAIVREIHARLPATHVVVEELIPKVYSPERPGLINAGLEQEFANARNVTLFDASPIFEKDGVRREELYLHVPGQPDVHPNPDGAAKVGRCLEPLLTALAKLPAGAPQPPRLICQP